MKKYILLPAVLILIIALPALTYAAELYGKFSSSNPDILLDALVSVKCNNYSRSTNISSDGKYSVRGIPGNQGCYFTITYPDSKYSDSPIVRFNTNRSVVTINAELRLKNNQILVLRR